MKVTAFIGAAVLAFFANGAIAQANIPEGYVKAELTLANGTVASGYMKDNMKKSSSILFIDKTGGNKKTYEGSDINAVKTDAQNYICISGDFFKVLSDGKMQFLQKQSNASGKASYNGAEAVFSSGTEGKVGDYLAYADKKLTLITKRTLPVFITENFGNCAPATEKAKAANGDISKLQEAIDSYNSSCVSK
jgi:hypothetical protein